MTTAAVHSVLQRHGLEGVVPALRDHLVQQRWFGGRERGVDRIDIADIAEMHDKEPTCLWLGIRTHYTDGGSDLYSVLVGICNADHTMAQVDARYRIATLEHDGLKRVVYDALADNDCSLLLFELMLRGEQRATSAATIRAEANPKVSPDLDPTAIRLISGEQSNTSLARGQSEFFKWVRRIEPGPSIETEMLDALRQGDFVHMPEQLGGIDYIRSNVPPTRLAHLQRYVHNTSEGWALALTSLRDLYASAEASGARTLQERLAAVACQGGNFTSEAIRLGEVTADMHVALASPTLTGASTPVVITPEMLEGWAGTMTAELDRLLASSNPQIHPLRPHRDALTQCFEALRHSEEACVATRIHGDYHLGQVLRTDAGWLVIDFEGEPARPPAERRLRWSPLRDVAGMLRSFDYAAAAALMERTSPADPTWHDLLAQGDAWAKTNRDAFWNAYMASIGNAALPFPSANFALTLRRAFEVQKAVYEVTYELGHRPDWVGIPLGFLLEVAQ